MLRVIRSMFLMSALTGLWGCAAITSSDHTTFPAFDTGDAGLNTPLLAERAGFMTDKIPFTEEADIRFNAPMSDRIVPSETAPPQLRGLEADMENGVRVYRPFSVPKSKTISHIHYQPISPEAVPEAVPATEYVFEERMRVVPQNTGPDVSYVKINGGSDFDDWAACEAKVGGGIIETETGYKIDPAFDHCMRAQGYVPENDAELELAGK